MSVSFIPLLVLFIVALVSMLVGLRLSSRALAADQREIEYITYVRRGLISNPSNGKYALKTVLTKHPNWLLLILGLGLIFSISLYYLYNAVFPSSVAFYPTKPYTPPLQLPQGVAGASKALKPLAQLDPSQYNSEQEHNVWSASACSAAAMTMVINAYGHNYRISDILHVAISQSAISPELGLLKLEGIDSTVAQFGFSTAQLSKAPLDSVISVANSGWPVIVDFPPGRDWPGGHFLVVTGGNSDTVFLADSSSYNFTSMPRQQFLRNWRGFAVVVMPKKP